MSAGIISADWLVDPLVQQILAVLSADGEEARINGGAIRNTLIGQPVTDIDIATTCLPVETVRRLEAAGLRAVPTGIEHGTVTAVADGRGFEVTTLRKDVATDGRRAVVEFGRDWVADAHRRDFTINALYCDADGTIHDLVGGRADIEARLVRFIGAPEDRITEDYLRILRFFRFFAWYGHGRPDAEGLKACARLKDGLAQLSAERIWTELRKTLAAPDPARALLWMRQAGVLSAILPESDKWGIDAIHGLVAAERALGVAPDPVLRLLAIVPLRPEPLEALSARLKVANLVRDRLLAAADAPPFSASRDDLPASLYRHGAQALTDRALMHAASKPDDIEAVAPVVAFARGWARPVFPVRGSDLAALGHLPGPAMGALLKEMEAKWIASGFTESRETLLATVSPPSG